jgi:competence ComEA-like helix-hairpin-helix protein
MKSHFTFTKKQRNGIFLLLLIILVMQLGIFLSSTSNKISIESSLEIESFQQEIDSVKAIKIKDSKPKVYPFNPNFITDYKGYSLGMSTDEIDRLLKFRAQDKWVNSAEQFQEVTQVSDSLLAEISTYFKFPEWVTNSKPKSYQTNSYNNKPKSFSEKIDLNKATASQLQKVNGVGEGYSKRIVAYREKYGGFIAEIELIEVYGLSPEVIQRINEQFTVKTPRPIEKYDLNSATKEQLVTIPYMDYEVVHHIIEQRILRDGFKSLDELTKVKDFPINKIEIIKLYLTLN